MRENTVKEKLFFFSRKDSNFKKASTSGRGKISGHPR